MKVRDIVTDEELEKITGGAGTSYYTYFFMYLGEGDVQCDKAFGQFATATEAETNGEPRAISWCTAKGYTFQSGCAKYIG